MAVRYNHMVIPSWEPGMEWTIPLLHRCEACDVERRERTKVGIVLWCAECRAVRGVQAPMLPVVDALVWRAVSLN